MIKEQRLSQNLPRMDWLTFSVFKDQANFLMTLMILPILIYEKYIHNNYFQITHSFAIRNILFKEIVSSF